MISEENVQEKRQKENYCLQVIYDCKKYIFFCVILISFNVFLLFLQLDKYLIRDIKPCFLSNLKHFCSTLNS